MLRLLANGMLTAAAIVGISALAFAEETIVEKRTYESQRDTVEVVPPAVKERVVEERTVTQPPAVQRRTDTVTTTTKDDDNDNDNDDDNDND
jgi:hypothetical protein